MLYYFAKIFLGPFAFVLMRSKVSGLKKLYRKGPLIIVSNHITAMDPVLLAVISPRVIRFMGKSTLFKNKLVDFILQKLLFCFPVDREGMGLDSLKRAMAVLQRGKVFGIFPEGRRNVTGAPDTLENGAAFLALRSGAPILPVWADPAGAARFKIHMRVGDPIDAKQLTSDFKGRPVEVVTQAITDSFRKLSLEMENE